MVNRKGIVWSMLLLLGVLIFRSNEIAAARPFQDIIEIPLFLHFFLLVNLIQLSVAIVMMLEIKKGSPSNVWDDNNKANFFNIFHTLALILILYKLYPTTPTTVLISVASLYTFAVFMVNVTEYFLVIPILKSKKSFVKIEYALFCILIPLSFWYIFSKCIVLLEFPSFRYTSLLYVMFLIYFFIILTFVSVIFSISKSFEKIGFVQFPFLTAGTGMIAIISALIFITLLTKNNFVSYFYYLSFYFIVSGFTSIYYLRFGINYPALLQPKLKTLFPFDLPKITASATFTFLAISIYLTIKDYPNFAIYQTIPYIYAVLLLLPFLFTIIFTLTYMKHLYFRTKLKYWEYLKCGLFIHIAVTLYIFSLLFLSWSTTASSTKIWCILFGVVSFLFYLFFALDLRSILEEQEIEPVFDKVGMSTTIITFYSCFFIILFSNSFVYGGYSSIAKFEFISNPLLLFFVAFFLIAFGTYLSITHKGFEEILGKNIWSEFSYISAFLAFLMLYLIYSSMGAQVYRFPYRNLAFIGYFVVLLIEILSTMTLSEKYSFTKKRKDDIVDLLNFNARAFLRTDYLEDFWRKTVSSYLDDTEREKVSFDPARRAFDLTELDEETQRTIAVSMLLLMHKLSEGEKVAIQRKSLGEAKGEIVEILREKILQLPEELRAEFDEDLYYPLLLEKSINDLLTHLRTFISASEHEVIFEGLKRRDEVFACVDFETEEIHVREGTRFGRDKFLELFKLYLDAVGDKFPFKRCLLRGLVKEEIRTDAHAPIAASEVFDIISTGIKELNLVMAGGLVKGSSTLLITEETKAKQRILHSLITRNLPEGMSILYATSKRPYQQIQGELLMELDSVDRVTMLDLYAPLYEEKGVSELVEYDHRILVPLSKILFQRSFVKAIKSQPRNQPRLVIIDVYDDFAKYYQPEEIYELLQTQVEGLKRWDCTTILVLDPHSHLLKKVGVDEVKKNFENILVLAGAEKETVVQIEKLFHGTPGKRVVPLEW
jgi:KaiC/GvpD/RAD55 family RecA-like ATPase